jgi:hypothetical protein
VSEADHQTQIEWTVDLAETYLSQALVELTQAWNTEWVGGLALRQRVESSRRSIIFSALSAEAYINQFLAQALDASDFRALDRLPTTEKYVVGPRVALDRALFDRGAEPMGTLRRLFKMRDELVHPKPRKFLVPAGQIWHEPTYADHNPEQASRFALAVSAAAITLGSADDPPTKRDLPEALVSHSERFLEISRRITAVPMPTDDEIRAEFSALRSQLPPEFFLDEGAT